MRYLRQFAMLILICGLGVSANVCHASGATKRGTCGDCTYTNVGGQVTISGEGVIKMPKEGWGNVTSVIIESGPTEICDSAFSGCKSLVSIDIPGSVEIIGNYALSGCSSLEQIKLNNGLKHIGNRAFGGTSIEKLVIPDGVKSIGNMVFGYCLYLDYVYIPSSVNSIGLYLNMPGFDDMYIKTPKGSYAEKYCKKYKINTQRCYKYFSAPVETESVYQSEMRGKAKKIKYTYNVNGKVTLKVIKGDKRYISVTNKVTKDISLFERKQNNITITLKKNCKPGIYKVKMTIGASGLFQKSSVIMVIKVKSGYEPEHKHVWKKAKEKTRCRHYKGKKGYAVMADGALYDFSKGTIEGLDHYTSIHGGSYSSDTFLYGKKHYYDVKKYKYCTKCGKTEYYK